MAIIIRGADQATGDTISTGDDYILREGVLVSDDNSEALLIDTVGGNLVQIGGSLFSSVYGLFVGATDVTASILATGSVAGGSVGVYVLQTGAEITNAGSVTGGDFAFLFEDFATGGVVMNSGSVTGANFGFVVRAAGTAISNSGTVSAKFDAIATGLVLDASGLRIDNSGVMRGGERGLDLNVGEHEILNSGLMAGGINGIRIGTGGTGFGGNGIVNSGTIQGDGIAIQLEGTTGNTQIQNAGHIRGGQYAVQSTHQVLIASSGFLAANTGIELGASADFSTISNSGRIDAVSRGIELLTGADNVTVGNDGVIAGAAFGILSDGLGTSVVNTGTITPGAFGTAVYLGNAGGTLVNSGTLTGQDAVTFLAPGRIVNSGVIDATRSGLELYSFIAAGSAMVVQNEGTISGGSRAAVDFFVDAVTPLVVRNTGTLTSDLAPAISTFNDSAVSLFNAGFLVGGAGIALSTGTTKADRVTNLGSIDGNVLLSGGSDIVVNGGTILGDVDLGADNDRYLATGQGGVTGQVLGGTGLDTLTGANGDDNLAGGGDADVIAGHAGDDTLLGDSGNDRILGGAGNDEINGGTENDTLNGQDGDDTIEGEAGNDILLGQAGVDFLVGASGNDTLDGGEGDDSIYGGADADVLRGRGGIDYIDGGLGRDVSDGGPGADLFIFNSVFDSTPDANRDVILDFEKGIDTINLVNVVPGAFVFRGTLGFTATGGPELRLFVTGDSTIVRMDIDGNGTADMEIRVAGVTGLTAGDFEL